MRFENLNIEIDVKPLSAAFSRSVASKVKCFAEPHVRGGSVEVADDQAAEFLTSLSHYLIKDFYGTDIGLDGFENGVTLDEVLSFLKGQVEANGPRDFLLHPLRAMLLGFEGLDKIVSQMVEENKGKLLEVK